MRWAGASPTPCRCSTQVASTDALASGDLVGFRHSVVSPWGRRSCWLAAWRRRSALAERALALAHEHQERGHQAYALRLLGEIAAQREPPERRASASPLPEALTLAEELGMRPLQAHCHRGLGTLYATTGQQEQARTALSTAIDMYRAMEMTFWLPQAEAALAQVEGQ